ncbi:MAG: hypothetical protein A2W07_06915 [candidate division Zixibacteria bacterium RBG_16_43_9]|nr:MAG: hypothetical protein A2W07_06915 [candidate division Zixibacteria bacterium RBG_16_43_9]
MEPKLLSKLMEHDNRSWRNFLKEHDRFIRPIIFRNVKNKQDFEDCYQDLMTKLSSKLASYRPGEPFKPWLFRVVTNHTLQWRKKNYNPKSIQTPFIDTKLHNSEDKTATAEDNLLCQELMNIVNSVIKASGNNKEVKAFVMYYLNEIPYPEIAKSFFINIENARNRVSRGKRIFGKLLISIYGEYFQERKK